MFAIIRKQQSNWSCHKNSEYVAQCVSSWTTSVGCGWWWCRRCVMTEKTTSFCFTFGSTRISQNKYWFSASELALRPNEFFKSLNKKQKWFNCESTFYLLDILSVRGAGGRRPLQSLHACCQPPSLMPMPPPGHWLMNIPLIDVTDNWPDVPPSSPPPPFHTAELSLDSEWCVSAAPTLETDFKNF